MARAEQVYRGGLPNYVKQEFSAYTKCGIHAHGFARARCQSCGHMLLVAFSCKKRGICPSCSPRRMADTAARLVDHVLPDVRLRQWVLSVPFELRLLLAKTPEALSAVGRIFVEEVFRWQRSLGIRMGLSTPTAAKERLRGGAICFPQRFGGSLNLNVHYHVIVPDALFYRDVSGNIATEILRRPTRGELEDATYNVAIRCLKWLRKNGHLKEEDRTSEPTLMEMCLSSSVGLGNLAALTRKGEFERVTPHKQGSATHKVKGGNFNIHVGDPAAGKEQREHLIRYCARAPLSLERLSVSEDGKVVYQLKHPIRGRTHRVMEPHQFLARLCALIPPPRHPLIRFHGVFGPASKWRSEVIPQAETRATQSQEGPPEEGEGAQHVETKWQSQRLDWATLLHRVYDIDALRCECGGDIHFEELVEEPKKARAFLELHQIESPRQSGMEDHIQPWSDAPNIALNIGGWSRQDSEVAQESSQQEATTQAEPTPSASTDDSDFKDEVPPEHSYLQDEVPPD